MVPDLLTLGDDCFIADGVMLGDEEQRGGWMVLKPTRIGNRSFVGNGAYVPDGAAVPDDVLIGVQTRTPDKRAARIRPDVDGLAAAAAAGARMLHGVPRIAHVPPLAAAPAGPRVHRGACASCLPLAAGDRHRLPVIVDGAAGRERGWGSASGTGRLALAGCLYGLGVLPPRRRAEMDSGRPLSAARGAHVDALRLAQRGRHQPLRIAGRPQPPGHPARHADAALGAAPARRPHRPRRLS